MPHGYARVCPLTGPRAGPTPACWRDQHVGVTESGWRVLRLVASGCELLGELDAATGRRDVLEVALYGSHGKSFGSPRMM